MILITLEYIFGVLGVIIIGYLLYKHMIPYDLKVEGMAFFLWGILNLINGTLNVFEGIIINQTYVSIGIGFITLVIAAYKYYSGGRIKFSVLKNGK